jgi:methionyl aminopeptidase
MEEIINIYNILGGIHDKIENDILKIIKPDMTVNDLCLFIEDCISKETSDLSYDSKGIAFPVGININNCAAHYSTRTSSITTVIKVDDVVKIDYGIHINGHILDAAFTVAFLEKYRQLLEVSRKACMEASKIFTNDKPLIDITKKIQSEIPKHFGVIRDLCGHQIKPYMIHGGKVVPNVVIDYDMKALAGEIYTVEPFVSTTKDPQTYEDTNVENHSHYMFNYFKNKFESASGFIRLLPIINSFKTLAFNYRWLSRKEQLYIEKFTQKGLYNCYPPIYETNSDAKIAQFETTLLVTNGEPILFKKYYSVDKYIISSRK